MSRVAKEMIDNELDKEFLTTFAQFKCHCHLKRYDEAEESYKKLLELIGKEHDVLENLRKPSRKRSRKSLPETVRYPFMTICYV